jgi:hypothetical protein
MYCLFRKSKLKFQVSIRTGCTQTFEGDGILLAKWVLWRGGDGGVPVEVAWRALQSVVLWVRVLH